MNLPPIVSVVLPTLNRARTLGRAIQSVLDQTFGDFELIIVDDRSTDDTTLVFDKYANQEKVRLISQLAPGCAAARNVGVCISRGRYIAFQDSDDEWVPDKLERAVGALEDSGPEVGVFYSDMIRIEKDGRRSYWQSPDVERGVLVNERILDFQVACIGIQSAVIKRECFLKAGLFDERLPRFIDLELFIRLADQFDFIHCREPLVRYYSVDGISTDSRAQVIARTYLIEKYRHRLEVNPYCLAGQQLQLRIAIQQEENHLISARLREQERVVQTIRKSLGWRLLDWYGRTIKYPYLLPVYKLLGIDRSDRL